MRAIYDALGLKPWGAFQDEARDLNSRRAMRDCPDADALEEHLLTGSGRTTFTVISAVHWVQRHEENVSYLIGETEVKTADLVRMAVSFSLGSGGHTGADWENRIRPLDPLRYRFFMADEGKEISPLDHVFIDHRARARVSDALRTGDVSGELITVGTVTGRMSSR